MSYALLWIESLTALLLWISLLKAHTARFKYSWLARWTLFLASVIPLLLLVGFSIATGAVKFAAHLENNWFYYALSLLVSYFIGMIAILWIGRYRPEPGMAPAAAAWPLGKLAAATLAAAAVWCMTVWNMDLAQKQQAEILSVKAGAMFASWVPPAVPESRNAAVLYNRVFADVTADRNLIGRDSPLGNDADPNDPEVLYILAKHARSIELLHQAALLPDCRFDLDWSHPDFRLMLPELDSCRLCANLLELHARYQASAGNIPGAITDINSIFAIAAHVGEEPILISGLVSIGIDALGESTLEKILPQFATDAQLDSLQLPDPQSILHTLHRGMSGEECFGMATFSEVEGGELTLNSLAGDLNTRNQTTGMIEPLATFFRLFAFSGGIEQYTQFMETYRSAADKPFYEVQDILKQQLANLANAKNQNLFFTLFTPSLNRAFETFARNEAYMELQQTAVAFMHWHLAHGSFPTSLNQLVPAYLDAVPLDPFDGHPLRLVTRDGKIIIYSIGPDLKDDGGKPIPDNAYGKTPVSYDLVFTLPAQLPPTPSQ